MQGQVKWLVSDPIETNRVWGSSLTLKEFLKFQTLSKPIGYGGLKIQACEQLGFRPYRNQ